MSTNNNPAGRVTALGKIILKKIGDSNYIIHQILFFVSFVLFVVRLYFIIKQTFNHEVHEEHEVKTMTTQKLNGSIYCFSIRAYCLFVQ